MTRNIRSNRMQFRVIASLCLMIVLGPSSSLSLRPPSDDDLASGGGGGGGGGGASSPREDDLFVFPSMQMTSPETPFESSGKEEKGVKMEVEVNHRGQPKASKVVKRVRLKQKHHKKDSSGETKDKRTLLPTPIPEKLRRKLRHRRRRPKSMGAAKATATTWNPDAVDHTVNPNKSRKRAMVTPVPGSRPRRGKTVSRESLAAMGEALSGEAGSKDHISNFLGVEEEFKSALESSFDYKEWKDMKDKFLSASLASSLPPVPTTPTPPPTPPRGLGITIEEVHTERAPRTTQTFGPVTKDKAEREDGGRDQVTEPTTTSSSSILMNFPHFPDRSKLSQQDDSDDFKLWRVNYDAKDNRRETTTEKSPPPPPAPPVHVTLSSLYENAEESNHIGSQEEEELNRPPRDFSIRNQAFSSNHSVGIHHSADIVHGDGPRGPLSFQSLTIVHPKEKEERQSSSRESHFLPPQITLHTTARPGKAHLPPYLKNQDTVVVTLPKMKPTDVPDGYELIPLDKLTSDHEVVPWEEAQKVLQVEVAPLGEPKDKPEPQSGYSPKATATPTKTTHRPRVKELPRQQHYPQSGYQPVTPNSFSGESQSGYSPVPTSPKPKKEFEYGGEPQSGYVSTTTTPPPPPTFTRTPINQNSVVSTAWPPKRNEHTKKPRDSSDDKTTETTKRIPRRTTSKPLGYGTPQSGYSPSTTTVRPHHGGGFGTPQSGYSLSTTTTASPPRNNGYGTPQSGFSPSTTTSKKPHIVYGTPHKKSPTGGYGSPQSGYGAPPSPPREKPWYKPPPISPDLPALFYDDAAPKLKEESPWSEEEDDKSEAPPVVKSLGYGSFSPYSKPFANVIHFGSDFGPRPTRDNSVYHNSGPDYVKSLHRSPYPTTTPYHLPSSTPYPHTTYSTTTTLKPDHTHYESPYTDSYSTSYVKTHRPGHTKKPSYVKELLPKPTALPNHEIKHHGTPTPHPKTTASGYHLPSGYEKASPQPRLIPLPTVSPQEERTSTTSPTPYEHWTKTSYNPAAPDQVFFKPTPGSFVRIQYSPSPGSGGTTVKSLGSPSVTPSTKYPGVSTTYKSIYPQTTPKPTPSPYHEPSMKPYYQSTPKPYHEEKPKSFHHSTPKPYHDAPPKSYKTTPKPKSHYKPRYQASTPKPKPQYHSSPKPSYHESTPKPKPHYYSTPKPSYHESTPKPKPHHYSTPKPHKTEVKLKNPFHGSTPNLNHGPSLIPIHYNGPQSHRKPTPDPHYHREEKNPTPKPLYKYDPYKQYSGKNAQTPKDIIDPENYHELAAKLAYHLQPHYKSTLKTKYEDEGQYSNPSHGKPSSHYVPPQKPSYSYQSTMRPPYQVNSVAPPLSGSPKPVKYSTPKSHHHSTPKPQYHEVSPVPAHPASPSIKPYGAASPKPEHHYHETKPKYEEKPGKYYQNSTPEPSYKHTPTPDYQGYPSGRPHSKPHHSPLRPHEEEYQVHHPSLPKSTYSSHPKPKSLFYSKPKPTYDSQEDYKVASIHEESGEEEEYPSHPSVSYVTTARPYPPTPSPTRQLPTGVPHSYGHSTITPHPYHQVSTMGPYKEIKEKFPSYHSTTAKPQAYYHSTPSPDPSYRETPPPPPRAYSPSSHSSHVKSLPYTQSYYPNRLYYDGLPVTAAPPPSSYAVRHDVRELPIGTFPDDIPLSVDHFVGAVSPHNGINAGNSRTPYYTSPKPVYLPGPDGSLIMKLPDGLNPEYSPSYSAGQIERSSDYRMEQLKKYLESLGSSDSRNQIDPDILKGLIDTIAGDNNSSSNFKISIPTPAPVSTQTNKKVSYDITSFQRQPKPAEQSIFASSTPATPSTFASTSTTRSTTRTTRSPGKPERLTQSGEDVTPGQIVIKGLDGSVQAESEEEGRGEQWVIRPLSPEEKREPIPFLEVDRKQTSRTPTPKPVVTSRGTAPARKTTTTPEGSNAEEKLMSLFEKLMKNQMQLSQNVVSTTTRTTTRQTTPSTTARPIRSSTTVSPPQPQRTDLGLKTTKTLKQMTATLRGLTSTVRGLNRTILEATSAVRAEVPPGMLHMMQQEIAQLTETVRLLRENEQKQDSDFNRQRVKEVLLEVVREAQKVAKLKSDLSSQGLETRVLANPQQQQQQQQESILYPPNNYPNPPQTPSVVVGQDGVKTHYANGVEWTVVNDKDQRQNPNGPIVSSMFEAIGSNRPPRPTPQPVAIITSPRPTTSTTPHPPQVFNIPVSASLGGKPSLAGASIVVAGPGDRTTATPGELNTIPTAVGSSFAVDAAGNVIPGSQRITLPERGFSDDNPFVVSNGGGSANSFATSSQNPLKLDSVYSAVPSSAVGGGGRFPSTPLPGTPTPPSTYQQINTAANFVSPGPSAVPNVIHGHSPVGFSPSGPVKFGNNNHMWVPSPAPGLMPQPLPPHQRPPRHQEPSRDYSNRPVRFPESVEHRYDPHGDDEVEADEYYSSAESQEYPQHMKPLEHQYTPAYYSTPSSLDVGGGYSPKSGVNIMAELAPGHRGQNLLSPTPTPRGYFDVGGRRSQEGGAASGLEVIVYPSGQLLKGADPESPPSSTIGPLLESTLMNHYYRDQLPHYVLAKSKRRMEIEGDTELFDPTVESDDDGGYNVNYYDGDQSYDSSSSNLDQMGAVAATAASAVASAAGGFFKGLMRTASDDLHLVGNVLMKALT